MLYEDKAEGEQVIKYYDGKNQRVVYKHVGYVPGVLFYKGGKPLAGNLISQDGGGLVASGGGNLIALGGGNQVASVGGKSNGDGLAVSIARVL